LILLDKEKNSYGLIEGILQSYNDPPQDVKDFLIKMASNKKKSHIVASGIQQIPSMGGDFKKTSTRSTKSPSINIVRRFIRIR
jgi:hypothetical protein